MNNDIVNIEENNGKKVTTYKTKQCKSNYPTLT